MYVWIWVLQSVCVFLKITDEDFKSSSFFISLFLFTNEDEGCLIIVRNLWCYFRLSLVNVDAELGAMPWIMEIY